MNHFVVVVVLALVGHCVVATQNLTFVFEGEVFGNDTAPGEANGHDVVIGPNSSIFVNAYSHDHDGVANVGAVYEFRQDEAGTWTQYDEILPNVLENEMTCKDMCVNDNDIFFLGCSGLDGENVGAGVVFVFERNPSGIFEQISYVNTSLPANAAFGCQMACSVDRLVVGECGSGGDGVHFFERGATNAIWNKVGDFDPTPGNGDYTLEIAMSQDSTNVAVRFTNIEKIYMFSWGDWSTPLEILVDNFDDSQGRTLVFNEQNTLFSGFASNSVEVLTFEQHQNGSWVRSNPIRFDLSLFDSNPTCGYSLSADDGFVVVDCRLPYCGMVFIVKQNNATKEWEVFQQIEMEKESCPISSQFGQSVHLRGDLLVVGSIGTYVHKGSAHIYRLQEVVSAAPTTQPTFVNPHPPSDGYDFFNTIGAALASLIALSICFVWIDRWRKRHCAPSISDKSVNVKVEDGVPEIDFWEEFNKRRDKKTNKGKTYEIDKELQRVKSMESVFMSLECIQDYITTLYTTSASERFRQAILEESFRLEKKMEFLSSGDTIFLSHAVKDHEVCTALVNDLRKMVPDGVNVFYDFDNLEKTSQIHDAISKSRYFFFVVTPTYVTSRWCLQELIVALDAGIEVAGVGIQNKPLDYNGKLTATINLMDDIQNHR